MCSPLASVLNHVHAYLFPGLPPGNSRGPLGTLIPSLRCVLLLRALALSLGRRSTTGPRVAEAGIDGFRNPSPSSGLAAVRWNLRRVWDSAVLDVSSAQSLYPFADFEVTGLHSGPESSVAGVPFLPVCPGRRFIRIPYTRLQDHQLLISRLLLRRQWLPETHQWVTQGQSATTTASQTRPTTTPT